MYPTMPRPGTVGPHPPRHSSLTAVGLADYTAVGPANYTAVRSAGLTAGGLAGFTAVR